MYVYSCNVFLVLFDSMFIYVEDRTEKIRFPYNYSMNFTVSNMIITKQTGDISYTC